MNNKIEKGNYMRKQDVINYVKEVFNLNWNINTPTYMNGEYLNANDVKFYIGDKNFREMECHVPTQMMF